jgi:glutamate dehydrogenase
LRREILATHLTNALVNRVGCAFVHRLMEETDAQPGEIVRACIMTRDVFDLDAIWRAIDALDNRVPDDVQARMFVDIARLLERAALWFLRHLQAGEVEGDGVGTLLARCRDAVERLAPQLPALLPEADLEALSVRQGELVNAGVESTLALRVSSGEISVALLDIADVAAACARPLEFVASTYFALGTRLNYGWISERAAALPTPTHWDTMARAAALAEVGRLKRMLTTSVLAQAGQASDRADAQTLVDAWCAQHEAALERYERLLVELRASSGVSLSVLLVIVRAMAALERA